MNPPPYKPHFVILRNEREEDHALWVQACEARADSLTYSVVDLSKASWQSQLRAERFALLLARPPGHSAQAKQQFDERLDIISRVLKWPVYPTAQELRIYENKRYLAYWLQANGLPHPPTRVFYDREEAFGFLRESHFPLVAKRNIGASGSGVYILKSRHEAQDYLHRAFSAQGVPVRWGPNLKSGNLAKRLLFAASHPSHMRKRISTYRKTKGDIQAGQVLLQDYVPHEFEWRVVAIGGSYFAHKKVKSGDKASGSLLKDYSNPPLALFDFAREIMDAHGFYSQAMDLFETAGGGYLINEMQCLFGQSDPYQMLVDGVPGRYRFLDGTWRFEAGDFNTRECYDLRIEHALSLSRSLYAQAGGIA